MKQGDIIFYLKDAAETVHDATGRPVLAVFESKGMYSLPYEIKAPSGHDFDNCGYCRSSLKKLEESFSRKFTGDGTSPGFPFCCGWHKNLLDIKAFDRNDFAGAPEMAARKIIYTCRHILDSFTGDGYYGEITDYIEYAVQSFGSMPESCGEPFLLGVYMHIVKNEINRICETSGISDRDERRKKLLEYMEALKNPEGRHDDISALVDAYNRWLKIFPFDTVFFSGLKQKFGTAFPLIRKESLNRYSGRIRVSIYTKEELAGKLVSVTDQLLKEINTYRLYKQNRLSDLQGTELELVLAARKARLEEGYLDDSPDEERQYRRIIGAWLADEKNFIREIAPFIRQMDREADKPAPPVRTINTEKLKDYFTGSFKGMGNGTVNNFDTMVEELKTDRTAKEFAYIAYMIWKSGKLNGRKPGTFSKWYKLFCDCTGCEKKAYKPNNLKNIPGNLAKLFNYL